MFIPDTTDNIRTILSGLNDANILYNLAENHPDLVANVIVTYLADAEMDNTTKKNSAAYMRIFNEYVVPFVETVASTGVRSGHSHKIAAIKAIRQAYNLSLADATGTICKWIELYEYNKQFVPEFLYTLYGDELRRLV